MTEEIKVFVRIPAGSDGEELLVEHKKASEVAGTALTILTDRVDEENMRNHQTQQAIVKKKK